MDELDRIFDGENMAFKTIVYIIDHARQCRRFTRPCGSGYKDQAFVLFTQLFEDGRHAEFFQTHDFRRDGAEYCALALSLHKHVDAKSSDPLELKGKIALVGFLEYPSLSVVHDIVDERMNFLF